MPACYKFASKIAHCNISLPRNVRRNQEHGVKRVNDCLKVLITIVAEVLCVILHFLCKRIHPSPHTGTSVGRAWMRGDGRERGEGGEGERERREGREKEREGRGGRKREKGGEGERERREGRGGERRGAEGEIIQLSCIVHVHF